MSFDERQLRDVLEGYEARTDDRRRTGKDCCALRILEAQPDFTNEIYWLQQIAREAGHQAILYSNFRCELDDIEYFWAVVNNTHQRIARTHFLNLSLLCLLDLISVNLKTIRRFAMRRKHGMTAYINGLTEEQWELPHRRETRYVIV